MHLKKEIIGLPWWSSGYPPASAGGIGSIPGLGRSPHAAGQLSLCATTTEAPVLCTKKPPR